MARKGKEIALQREIETQEDWEDMLSKEGLCVVDVYQEWCGPTVGMVGTFRKIKNELGDDLLKFLTAKSDTIDALEKYRGRCEPCFLFFAGGVLVAVIRGANAPLILRTITEQLAQEHKVLDGQAERKEIKDTMIAKLEEQDKQKEDEEAEEEARRMWFQEEIVDFGDDLDSEEEQKKEVSVVIIKPDAVQSGKAEEIMEEMKRRGIEILREERRLLTDDEVKNVYIHLQDESYFEDLVAFMTSAESIVLAITKGKTGENIIKEFRDLIGPTDTEEAKEKAPESLRAKFGSEKYMNAVHGSDSSDTAARELAFFFPDFVAPTVDGAPKIQRTLALIRPDAYKNNREQILAKIRESGFKVAMQKEIQLTKAEAEDFYREHEGQDYFEELTNRMSNGPLLALGLAREDAVSGWRQMLGPTLVDDAKEKEPDSLRAQFAEEGANVNMLHGSDSEERAQKEIEYFFPMEQTLAVIKPDAYQTKDEIIEKIHESGFRIAARKETTLSREIAEQFYADHQGKEFYNELVEHMCSGPTYFMVLSREGAVDGWRSLIGPTDPTKAKETHPDTLRGMYGQDPLRNAVHGSSNKEHAIQNIEKIFGELFFNKDGTVKEDKEVKKLMGSSRTKTAAVEPSPVDKSAPVQDTQPNDTPSSNGPAGEASGVPDVVVHEVPSLNPDLLEEAIAEQQDISYETAPENIGSEEKQVKKEPQPKQEPQQEEKQVKKEPQPKQEPQQEEKPSSPKPEEKKEEDEGKPELTEQTGDQEVTEEQVPQQQEETKPAEQEPTQQEQSEAQEVKQDEEAQPAPETAPEPTPEAGQEKAETEEKPKTPEAQAQEPEATPTEQTQGEPEKQPEPEAEQKEESKPDEPKPEESKPEESKPEESKPEESKPEETPKEEQTEAKPEAQAEKTEEKKDEPATEQKEESKTEEQKPAEGEAQQTA